MDGLDRWRGLMDAVHARGVASSVHLRLPFQIDNRVVKTTPNTRSTALEIAKTRQVMIHEQNRYALKERTAHAAL